MQPHREQPTRFLRSQTLQARTLEWVAISCSDVFTTPIQFLHTHTKGKGERKKLKEPGRTSSRRVLLVFVFFKQKLPCGNPLREQCPLRPERSSKSKVQQNDGTICRRVPHWVGKPHLYCCVPLVLWPHSTLLGRKERKGWEDHEPGNNNNLKITTQPLKPPH